MSDSSVGLRKIAVVLGVVVAFVLATGVLMPSLQSARSLSAKRSMAYPDVAARVEYLGGETDAGVVLSAAGRPGERSQPVPSAHVRTFVAQIELIPRLSQGTQRPESIYETRFHGTLTAAGPGDGVQDCRLDLPLPPELISLADLTITVNGDPSEKVARQGDKLVWTGRLDGQAPARMEVTYSAMGRGIFTLNPPTGSIVDEFAATITAHQSDIRMMQLSLQPQKSEAKPGAVTYAWSYKRLIFGRPIVLDVLGIAPADRLAELVWLGPVSVLVFGLLAALLALATRPATLDVWMVLLLVGAFAGSYPLMYFAQDFLPLSAAVLGAAAVALLIIAVRGTTLLGWRLGLFGPTLLAAGVDALTLLAAIWPSLQGVLLTLLAIATLVLTMILLPRVRVERPPTTPKPAA